MSSSTKNLTSGTPQSPPIWLLVFNLLGYQCVWFVSVQAGSFIAALTCVTFIGLHLFFVSHRRILSFSLMSELAVILGSILLGVVVEILLTASGVWQGLSGWHLPPVWLLCLWAAFACCLRVGLRFLMNAPLAALVLGGVFAPLSYWGGAQLNPDYNLAQLPSSLVVVSFAWAFSMYLLALWACACENYFSRPVVSKRLW